MNLTGIFFTSVMLTATASIMGNMAHAGEDLLDLPATDRQSLVKQATVFRDSDSRSNDRIDIVELLREECGFNYQRDSDGRPVRPMVECTYAPRDPANPFGGMMAKFDCKIQPTGREAIKTKVKYDPKHSAGGGSKEIPQGIMGTLLSRVMGFEGNLYCPVDVTCVNCPSKDPWAQQKSQAAAVPGNRVEFKNVILEKKIKGAKILQTNPKLRTHPTAFSFANDFLQYLPSDSAEKSLADREALTIWVNFLNHHDAGAYNMALNCKSALINSGKPSCESVTASINDYGDGFGYHKMGKPMELDQFLKEAPGVVEKKGRFTTEGAKGSSNPGGIVVSKAGVLRFVEAAEKIDDQELSDILDLAQIEAVSKSRKQEWMSAFRQKIENLRRMTH